MIPEMRNGWMTIATASPMKAATCLLLPKVFLDGPYGTTTGMMDDGMRALGLVPTTRYPPRSAIRTWAEESTTAPVLALSGNDAIVDWVVLGCGHERSSRGARLEMRPSATRWGCGRYGRHQPGLLLRCPGNYHVVVKHRNHLGCMTPTRGPFRYPAPVDFTSLSTATYGATPGRPPAERSCAKCSGPVTSPSTARSKYTGSGNDRDGPHHRGQHHAEQRGERVQQPRREPQRPGGNTRAAAATANRPGERGQYHAEQHQGWSSCREPERAESTGASRRCLVLVAVARVAVFRLHRCCSASQPLSAKRCMKGRKRIRATGESSTVQSPTGEGLFGPGCG